MRLGTCANALTVILGLLTLVPAAAQKPGPSSLDRVIVAGNKADASKWFRAESQRFIVYSDAGAEDVMQLLGNLEKLDHLLRLYTRAGAAGPREPKLTLYYHGSAAELAEIDAGMPARAVGLYSSCAAGVQGFSAHIEPITSLRDEDLDRAPLNKTLSYVFEAYARHFIYRHTDIRTPTSFIHGFAQYFSAVRFSENQMLMGRVPAALAGYLNYLADGQSGLEYEAVLRQDLAGGRGMGGAAALRLEFEAKAWLLTHYMLSSDDRRRRMNRYLALVGQGDAAPAAFEAAFEIKMSELSRVMRRYSHQEMQALRVAATSLPVARPRFHVLPRATGEFVLADAALKSCPDPKAGAKLLQKVTALAGKFPTDDLARLTLSRALIDWGDPRDAVPRLEDLLKDDESHFEARYLLGAAKLRLAERSEGDARRGHLEAARRHLLQARELNPLSPVVALALLKVEVSAAGEPARATLEGVTASWQSAREVEMLTRSAALAYAYTGHPDDAYAALASLAQNERSDPIAQWARQWQVRLEVGVSRGDILAEMRGTAPADTPFKEWTVEKDDVVRDMALIAGLEEVARLLSDQELTPYDKTRLLGLANQLRAKLNRSAGLVSDGR
jgi:tetratricopeptide (TPR) repeat protein